MSEGRVTVTSLRLKTLESDVKTLKTDQAKIKERLTIFFWLLLTSNVIAPELTSKLSSVLNFL